MKDLEDLPAQTPARSQPQSSGSIVCPCWWSPDSRKGQGPRASPLPLSHLRPASPRPDPAGGWRAAVRAHPASLQEAGWQRLLCDLGLQSPALQSQSESLPPWGLPLSGQPGAAPCPLGLAQAWRWHAGAPHAKCSR